MDVVHVAHPNDLIMNFMCIKVQTAKCEWQCLFAIAVDEIWTLCLGSGGWGIIYGFLHLFNTTSQAKHHLVIRMGFSAHRYYSSTVD